MCLWIRIPDQEMICGYQFFRISFYQEQNDPPICRAWGNGWERGKSCRGWGEGTGVRSDIWSPLFHLWVQLCVASCALSSSGRFCFRLSFFSPQRNLDMWSPLCELLVLLIAFQTHSSQRSSCTWHLGQDCLCSSSCTIILAWPLALVMTKFWNPALSACIVTPSPLGVKARHGTIPSTCPVMSLWILSQLLEVKSILSQCLFPLVSLPP